MRKKTNWMKKLLTVGLTATFATSLIPLSTEAANEYTVLGVSKFTNVTPNLDNADGGEFATKMNMRGWTKTATWWDSSVYYTDMTNYGNEADITYVTSHGDSSGAVILQDYKWTYSDSGLRSFIRYDHVGGTGYLKGNVNGVDGPGGDAEWFILAACNTLATNYWAKGVSKGVHHILGYVDVSYEGTDTKIVDYFLDRGWGSSILPAQTVWSSWINANRKYSLYNWAIVGHTANQSDYLTGSVSGGPKADPTSNTDVVRWKDNGGSSITTTNLSAYAKNANDVTKDIPTSEINQLSDKYINEIKTKREKIDIGKIRENLIGTDYKMDVNSVEKSHIFASQKGALELFNDNSLVYSRQIKTDKIDLTKEEVTNKVNEFINNNGGLRSDLVLASVIPMIEEDQEGNENVIGYTFQYKQKYDDTIIDGNFANGITVSYDIDGVNFYMRDVKDITVKTKKADKKVKQPKDIINKAKNVNNTPIKADLAPEYKNISLVYYSYPYSGNKNKLIPAYKLTITQPVDKDNYKIPQFEKEE